MKNIFYIFFIAIFLFSSCSLFEAPYGDVEIDSIFVSSNENTNTCTVYLNIINTSNKNIYSSTITVSAKTSLGRKKTTTLTSSNLIKPGNKISQSCSFSISIDNNHISSDTETWVEDEILIEDFFFY